MHNWKLHQWNLQEPRTWCTLNIKVQFGCTYWTSSVLIRPSTTALYMYVVCVYVVGVCRVCSSCMVGYPSKTFLTICNISAQFKGSTSEKQMILLSKWQALLLLKCKIIIDDDTKHCGMLSYSLGQKYRILRCLLRVKGLVICFYLGWFGSTLLITKHIIKLGSKS